MENEIIIPNLSIFGIQVFRGGKIKRRIEIVTNLASPTLDLGEKWGLCKV